MKLLTRRQMAGIARSASRGLGRTPTGPEMSRVFDAAAKARSVWLLWRQVVSGRLVVVGFGEDGQPLFETRSDSTRGQ